MPETLRVLAGDCSVTFEDDQDRRRERGHLLTLVKPDDTEKLLVE